MEHGQEELERDDITETETENPATPEGYAVPNSITEHNDDERSMASDPKDLMKSFLDAKKYKHSTDPDNYTVQVVTKYMCRYCGLQFDNTQAMQAHMAMHNRDKPQHDCSVCGKSYRTPSKLQRHVRVHTGERPFSCNICSRKFARSDHVKQHMRVHLPQKQKGMCRLCGLHFTKRQMLLSHLKGHGYTQVHVCSICGEAFRSVEEVQQHKYVHGMKEAGEIPPLYVAMAGETLLHEGLAQFSISAEMESGLNPLSMSTVVGQPSETFSNAEWDYLITKNETDDNWTTHLENDANSAVNENSSDVPQMEITSCYSLANHVEISPAKEDELKEHSTKSATMTDGSTMYVIPRSPESDSDEYEVDVVSKSKSEMKQLEGIDVKSLFERSTTMSAYSHINSLRNNFKASAKAAAVNIADSTHSSPIPSAHISPAPSTSSRSSPSIAPKYEPSNQSPPAPNFKKMKRCVHCCIWFEDFSMFLLHNCLHSTDDGDPFTCKKCLKKLGNRLEFMAHMVWHLEPSFTGLV